MFRCFCDICGKDITNYRGDKPEAQLGKLKVSVLFAIDGVWDGGHACEDCIRAACLVLQFRRREERQVVGRCDDDITDSTEGA